MTTDPRIERAINFIRDHFAEKLVLDDVARGAGLSPFHFHRLFKQITSETVNTYIQRIRLEYATHLITLYPQKAISQVAEESGFGSLAAFSRVYKQVYGRVPSQAHLPNTEDVRQLLETHRDADAPPLGTIEVNWFPEQWIACSLFNAFDNRLDEVLQQEAPQAYVGVFIDNIIHTPPEKCRYYLGALRETGTISRRNSYRIEEGLHAVFDTTGSWPEVISAMIHFKLEWLDASAYEIRIPVGFETLESQPGIPYTELRRRLHIPVQLRR